MRTVTAKCPSFWSGADCVLPDCANCLVRRFALRCDFDDAGLAQLRRMSDVITWKKGDTLCEQGMPADKVLIITEGLLKIYRLLTDGRRHVTGFLGPGDMLGVLKAGSEFCCTVEGLTAGRACAYDRDRFLRLITDHPELTLKLLITATDEIEAQHEHTILLGRRLAEERVAAFLLIFSHRWRDIDDVDGVVPLPMTREDIAEYLGLSLESVSRAFSRLKALGYIELPRRGEVVIRNVPALYQLSGFEEVPAHTMALGL